MLIAALDLYSKNKEDRTKAFILILDSSLLTQDRNGYKGFSLNKTITDQLKKQQSNIRIEFYLPSSTPTNHYKPNGSPYRFTLSGNRFSGTEESGQRKLFIPSSGAYTARPATLKETQWARGKLMNFRVCS
nr:hypothetical protein [Leptospira stimsonii]